jgi:hypothetical protein
MLYHTYDASYVLVCKNDKVVARNVGPKCKGGKTNFGSKVLCD